MRVVVAWKPADIMPFVGIVVHRADALRETFGFLPERAYWDMAEQGKLLVAVGHDDGDQHYLGHLLFDGTFPHGRVLQTHVEPKHRGRKVGKKLVQALVRRAEAAGFLSLRARVASDLRDANAFYDRMGFLQIQKKRGGRTRKREICIRVRELDTPNLLDWAGEPHRPPQWNALAHIRQSDRYVLDLNVLFDTVKRRPRSEASAWIVGAALNNIIRLAVTEELVSELERNTSEGDDPILEFARKLPRLATAPEPFLATVTAELAALIFPQRHASDRLTVQDRSDLIHLATSVYHQAAGFITAEKAILRAGEYLRRTYGINIIGPDEFVAELEPIVGELSSHSADVEGALLTAAVMNDERDHDGVLRFIDTMFVPVHERPNLVSRGATGAPVRRLLVKVAEDIIAVCSFQAPTALRPDTDLRLCADQDHPHARSAIEFGRQGLPRGKQRRSRDNPPAPIARSCTHARGRGRARLSRDARSF
jgi:GNAT superfamily N-acetyltransferase